MNNLYLYLTFSFSSYIAIPLIYLLLYLIGFPCVPKIYSHLNSKSNRIVWLPSNQIQNYLPWPDDRDFLTNQQLIKFNSDWYLKTGLNLGQLIWLMFIILPALSLSLIDRRVRGSGADQITCNPPIKRDKLFIKKVCYNRLCSILVI